MELIFATHNAHKLEEVQQMLPHYQLISLTDIGYDAEIVENGQSFAANAEIKVDAIAKVTSLPIFADDSGLVIPALDGSPGIYSSRYAGTGKAADNIQKVLQELKGKNDRSAYFVAVICMMLNQEKYFFEGKVEGIILEEMAGKGGFGYDPIFQPKGYDISFAAFTSEQKNSISHRGRAIKAMETFLNQKTMT